jgi:cytochrome c
MPLLLLLFLILAPLAPRAQDLVGHGGPVRALAVLEGGGLASAGFDGAVILWDPASGKARRVLRWHEGALSALAALPGGGLASAGEEGRIALWSPLGLPGGAEQPLRVLEGHAGPVTALAVAPGGTLASAGWDGTVRIWAADGAARVLEGHAGPVGALAWGATGLASAGADGTVRLWDTAKGRVLAEFGLPQNALAALPGGALAAGGADGFVRILQPDGTRREWAAGSRPLVALAVAPDGRSLAAASMGGSVGLWSVADGRLLRTLEGPGLPLWTVAFSADGASLWTGGQDRRVPRWDAATGAPLGPLAAAAEAALPAGADAEGARVFRACSACHALGEAAEPMAGPSLHRIFGRRMGSVPGYAYSPRLARGDITWTPETLADLFTRGPDVVTPGTRMPVQTVGEAGDLAALLRFLAVATQ